MQTLLPCVIGSLAMCASAHAGASLFWLRFEGGANNAALGPQTDISGGATATPTGACFYSTSVAPYAAAGTSCFNAGADFDYLTVADRPAFHAAGDFTLELLARPASPYPNTGGATGHMIVTKQIFNTGVGITSWGIGYDPPSRTFFAIVSIGGGATGGTQYTPGSAVASPPGSWYHVALVYRRLGTEAHSELYVNGTKRSDLVMPLTPVNYTGFPLYIGAGNYGSGGTDFFRRNFAGLIDEVRFSSGALSPGQFLVPNCPGDINGDNQVDDADFVLFSAAYNILDCADPAMPSGCPSDLNADGFVDDSDFTIFVIAYNQLLCP